MITSSGVDREFGQTKDHKLVMCCFSVLHATLRRNIKDWLARNQDNVPQWSDISTRGLLLQWASTITIQLNVFV